MKRIIALLLVVVSVFIFAITGCGKDTNSGDGINVINATGDDIYLIKDFKTSYNIVIPRDRSVLLTAAEELQNFLYQSTSCKLNILYEDELPVEASNKVISLGDTDMFVKTGIKANYSDLGESGYTINTKGFNIFICGATDTGTIYGVYKFLKKCIEFEAYAKDEIYITSKDRVYVYDYKSYVYVPDVDIINAPCRTVAGDTIQMARMGAISGYAMSTTLQGELFGGGLRVHSMFTVVSPNIYGEEHPDWFYYKGETAQQLCLSNIEMTAQFIENLKDIIEKNPNAKYFMLGNEDNRSYCDCDKCTAATKIYGSNSGIYCKFLNTVDNAIQSWMKETYPERHINLCGMAYFAYVEAPTKTTESGEIVPFCDDVILNDDIYLEYIFIDGCQAHALDDSSCEVNAYYYRHLKGWQKITKNFMVYGYDANFSDYFLPFNTFGAIQENYKLYKQLGLKFIFIQGGDGCQPFKEIKTYLYIKLGQDCNQNYNTLVNNFMKNYYKVASNTITQLYNNLRNHFTVIAAQNNIDICTGIYTYVLTNWSLAKYWPLQFLLESKQLIKKAYDEIENSNLSLAEKQILTDRVMYLEVSYDYRILVNYKSNYSDKQYDQAYQYYLDCCQHLGITLKSESGLPITID